MNENIRQTQKEVGPSDKQTALCDECPLQSKKREIMQLGRLLKEIDEFVNGWDTPDVESPQEADQDTFNKKPETPAEPMSLVDEADDELTVAEKVLQQLFVKSYEAGICKQEQLQISKALSVYSRLLEKERRTPAGKDAEKLHEVCRGLYGGYIHATATPIEDNLVQVDFYHTIRRKIVGRFVFELKFGSYYIKFVELLPF